MRSREKDQNRLWLFYFVIHTLTPSPHPHQLERMTPQERQDIWEQDHLEELQGNPRRRPYGLPRDNIERYAEFLHDQQYWDVHHQTMQIYNMQNNDYAEQCRRND